MPENIQILLTDRLFNSIQETSHNTVQRQYELDPVSFSHAKANEMSQKTGI